MSSFFLYGIANCNQVKKARDRLVQEKISYQFCDFKKQVLSAELLAHWCEQIDWNTLLNRRGTTWRSLNLNEQNAITDSASAQKMMLSKTSLIKRPLLCRDDTVLCVGFDESAYQTIFSK